MGRPFGGQRHGTAALARRPPRATHQVLVSARDHQPVGGHLVQGRAAVEVVLEGHPSDGAVTLEVGAEAHQILAVGAAVAAAHQLPQPLGVPLAGQDGGESERGQSDQLPTDTANITDMFSSNPKITEHLNFIVRSEN